VQLVFAQDHVSREEALTAERQIKGWSRKKKEAMMCGDWVEVSRLGRSRTGAGTPPVLRQAQDERLSVFPDDEKNRVATC
jgi:hypothetical protein